MNTPSDRCLGSGVTECASYIGGRWSEMRFGPLVELCNPANHDDIVSVSRHATESDAAKAMRIAAASFSIWKLSSISTRMNVVRHLRRGLDQSRESLSSAIHRETGKTLREAEQEVAATLQELDAQLDVFGRGIVFTLSDHRIAYEPLGPVLLVTPSNFPLAALMRKLVPALLSGNSIVVKGSELTPVTARLVFELIDRLDVPEGVLNLLLADGGGVMSVLIAAPELRAVSFTGSNAAGESIAALIGARDIRYQAELGGSNVAVVLADACVETAVDALVEHGFSCAGQWCTGTTRVVIEEAAFDAISKALVKRADDIRIGCDAEMGAMISARHLKHVQDTLRGLQEAGARVLTRPSSNQYGTEGFFLAPTILEASSESRFGEIFGPVLVLLRAKDRSDAIRIANDSCFGLSFSIFTDDEKAAEEAVSLAEAGLVHVNLGTGYRHSALPLFGWKQSGRGAPESGTWARDFFTQTKAIYLAVQ